MRTHVWPFFVVAGGQRWIFEKTVSCYRRTPQGLFKWREISCYGYFHEVNIVYFQGKYRRQPVHEDAFLYQGHYL